ncbi:HAD-IB family phosphatase [uncultured Selenomonas sp.]|uniref:HAD-IB family phosphatase n=1 Tax=uncultured Selenomonas sp. TaxID=159275 RepID=UPI0025F42E84|nr:HAD-IB family phosphatase [uncultured Selenomonas sp.]
MKEEATQFIFDLDGTITQEETLPLIAEHFGVTAEIEALTEKTVRGNIPFVESFIRRIYILGELPVDEVAHLLGGVQLHEGVAQFIREHSEQCSIATGNLRPWIEELAARLGCECDSSEAVIEENRVAKLTHILHKEDVVQRYQGLGRRVVFIGDGNNDVEAMRVADISIASALTHDPVPGVLTVADYLVLNEAALCRQLHQLS